MERARYHHGALKEALITAGLEHLENEGYESLSLRSLAQALGVSKTAPYRHFESKEDFVESLVKKGFSLLSEDFASSKIQGASARSNLVQIGRAYVDFALKYPKLYGLMFSNVILPSRPELFTEGGLAFTALYDLVQQAQDEGWKKSLDHDGLVITMAALVHGLALFSISDHSQDPDKKLRIYTVMAQTLDLIP